MRFWIEHFGYYWVKSVPNLEFYNTSLEITSEFDVVNIALDI